MRRVLVGALVHHVGLYGWREYVTSVALIFLRSHTEDTELSIPHYNEPAMVDFGNGSVVILLLIVVSLVFALFWGVILVPQNRARKRQEQVVAELKIGEEVVTVGGLIGKLTYLNREEDLAKIEIAQGTVVRIIPAAISHPLDYVQRLERLQREANAKPSKTK